MSLLRVVLDTNIVVSAVIWGGKPLTLLQSATAGDIELYTSPALLDELRDVLGRQHLASRLIAQRSSVEQAIDAYGQLAIGVSSLATPRVVPGDADDDHVIAAAVAAAADWIVSGDRHLLSLVNHQGIAILTPHAAVDRLAQQPQS